MANEDDPTQAFGPTEADGPPVTDGPPVMDPPSTDEEAKRRRRLLLLGLGALVLIVLMGGGIALAMGGGNGTAAHTTSSSTSSSSTTTTSLATSATAAPGQRSGGGGVAGGGSTTPAAGPKPSVTLTSSAGLNPSCSHDTTNFDSPTDPLDFTISWSGTNVTRTVFAIGGPGAGAYGAPTGPSGGSAHVSYGCGNSSHQFTVTATGPNGPAQKTITVNIKETAPPAAP